MAANIFSAHTFLPVPRCFFCTNIPFFKVSKASCLCYFQLLWLQGTRRRCASIFRLGLYSRPGHYLQMAQLNPDLYTDMYGICILMYALVIWKLSTNHHWVVAWLLLDANCPVLLTRGGIPQKGLTAQWLQQLTSSTEVSALFATCAIPT